MVVVIVAVIAFIPQAAILANGRPRMDVVKLNIFNRMSQHTTSAVTNGSGAFYFYGGYFVD